MPLVIIYNTCASNRFSGNYILCTKSRKFVYREKWTGECRHKNSE